ncbi:hypothetical protein MLD52_00535 [Puniceicoccaceae bacterium K14]|nr:hypothetical protein [Puniceicoccaceae bacterium K14]
MPLNENDTTANFCWASDHPGTDFSTCLFRREFTLSKKPKIQSIRISADSRYKLWVNGLLTGRGPLKGTLAHYHYETFDIAPYLNNGKNVIAVEVRRYGKNGPLSIVSGECAGLFVQDEASNFLDTPENWLTFIDSSVTPNKEDQFAEPLEFLGPLDCIRPEHRPLNWNLPDYDSSTWKPAVSIGPPPFSRGFGLEPNYTLFPSDIPQLTETPQSFLRALKNRKETSLPFTVEAKQTGEIWLDAGSLTTSYPVLKFLGSAGSKVRVTYAEALGSWNQFNGELIWAKLGRRNDSNSLDPHGYHDLIELPDGSYTFEPFHWRTFWFIKIEIEASTESVTLEQASHQFTTFPQDYIATFNCPEADIERYWNISLRTLRLCSHETYEDCPYFEQLSYIGDSRLQALCSYYLANNSQMARRSIRLFRDSMGANGLTAGRAPAQERQLIPAFSLHWILMLGDYWMWNGQNERAFVAECLLNVDAVLNYFKNRLNTAGFVAEIDAWAWTDWVKTWDEGVSPAIASNMGSTYLTALFAYTLKTACTLHRDLGNHHDAEKWSQLHAQLISNISDKCWSPSEGLFTETPHDEPFDFTQHSQTMAILAGASNKERNDHIMQRFLSDNTLAPCSLFHSFYLARALEETGNYQHFFSKLLSPWRDMVRNGLSTWQEEADPSRSDCHAWSSWIVVDFLRTILGARPASPGWKSICIRPQISATKNAKGQIPTPVGPIDISWKKETPKRLKFDATVPTDIPTQIEIPEGKTYHFPGGGIISLEIEF